MPPTPKRSDERRRRNFVAGQEQAPAAAEVVVPEPSESWHPLARDMFAALKTSGQSRFFEPSDWAFACILMDRMTLLIESGEPQPSAWAGVDAGLSRLLTTEGDRRRLRLELVREQSQADVVPASKPRRRLKAIDGNAS